MREVLIIGAAGGIGRATVEKFLDMGYDVHAADLHMPKIQDIQVHDVNVSDPQSVKELFHSLDDTHLVGVINLAGIVRDRTLLRMSTPEWEDVIAVNLTGSFNVVKHAAQSLKEKGGSIVLTGSTSALNGNFGQSNYAASKAGIQGLTRSSARELGRYNIRVNCVIPGFIKTEMTKAIPDGRKKDLLKNIPLGRAGEPTEISELIEFLVSDRSSYITGASILIDGGLRM